MNNIIIYNTEDGKAKINLILDDGSVLFVDRQGKTYKQVINEISLHNK